MHSADSPEPKPDVHAADTAAANVRRKVSLFGRFMTPDHTEYPCQVISMSPVEMDVICAHGGEIGMQVICYVNHVGRVEGSVTRQFIGGFEVKLVSSERKREKIASKLEWVESHKHGGTVDDRIHERVIPRSTLQQVSMPDGRSYPCRIIDISLSGAAIELDVRPALGSHLVLGGLEGVVVRQFDEGIALEFLKVQQDDTLERFVA